MGARADVAAEHERRVEVVAQLTMSAAETVAGRSARGSEGSPRPAAGRQGLGLRRRAAQTSTRRSGPDGGVRVGERGREVAGPDKGENRAVRSGEVGRGERRGGGGFRRFVSASPSISARGAPVCRRTERTRRGPQPRLRPAFRGKHVHQLDAKHVAGASRHGRRRPGASVVPTSWAVRTGASNVGGGECTRRASIRRAWSRAHGPHRGRRTGSQDHLRTRFDRGSAGRSR